MSSKLSNKLSIKKNIKKKGIKKRVGRVTPGSIIKPFAKKMRYNVGGAKNNNFIDLDTIRQPLDGSNLNSWLEYGDCPPDMKLNEEEFNSLWNERPDEYPDIIVYGKNTKSPRLVKNYLLEYKYSGKTINAEQKTPDILLKLLDCANGMDIDGSGHKFNQILVNWYEDGSKYISPHSDNEPELIKGSPILSLSFGATRRFRLKKIPGGEQDTVVELKNNSFVIMGGTCQTTHKHEVLKEPGCKNKRINITFRQFE